MVHSLRLVRVTHFLLLIVLLGFILIQGRTLLIPFSAGLLIAFLLKPTVEKLEDKLRNRSLAVLIGHLLFVLPMIVVIAFFSYEISHLLHNLGAINDQLKSGLEKILVMASDLTGQSPDAERHWLHEHLRSFIDKSFSFISSFLASSTGVFAELVLMFIFSFALLYYRNQLKNFILAQFKPENRQEVTLALTNTQHLSRKYAYGLGVVTLLLSVLYSIGFWIIGIPFAPFWGVLMGVMNIIPFIGNALGLIFLIFYVLAATTNPWLPLLILGIHFLIQTVEGNYLRPRIVGNTVNLNTFTSILALIVGGYVWGVAGMLLSLPFVAMSKILFDHINFLKPVGELMDTELYQREEVFLEKYDEDEYRLAGFFDRKIPGGVEHRPTNNSLNK